jgi:hypothetical protein
MASIQSVEDEAAWLTQIRPAGSISAGRLGSQSRNWLTKRSTDCRNFGLFQTKKRPNPALPARILNADKVLWHKAVNDD